MMKIALVDDDRNMLGIITNNIKQIPEIKDDMELCEFTNAEEILAKLKSGTTYDIIISDIEMGKMQGLEFGQIVRTEYQEVFLIFLTAYPHYAGNQVIDFVLNQKILQAEKKGVDFQIHTQTLVPIPLSESEICALFGNLLDNAIEAAQKATGEPGWVDVYISQKGDMLFVEIANNFLTNPIFENGELVSTKGSNHGYGIRSAKRVVDKYDGWMTFKADGHVFRVNILVFGFSWTGRDN